MHYRQCRISDIIRRRSLLRQRRAREFEMTDLTSKSDDQAQESAQSRGDRWLVIAGLSGAITLALVLWSQAGREVFASAMAGLWALCF
jgi:hypothetical protein